MSRIIQKNWSFAPLDPRTADKTTKESESTIKSILDMYAQQNTMKKASPDRSPVTHVHEHEVEYAYDVRICMRYATMLENPDPWGPKVRWSFRDLKPDDRPNLFIVPFKDYLSIMCALGLIDSMDMTECLIIIISDDDTELPRKLARLGNIRYDWRFDRRIKRRPHGHYIYEGYAREETKIVLSRRMLAEMEHLIDRASVSAHPAQSLGPRFYATAAIADAILNKDAEAYDTLHESVDLMNLCNEDPRMFLADYSPKISFKLLADPCIVDDSDQKLKFLSRLIDARNGLLKWYRDFSSMGLKVDTYDELFVQKSRSTPLRDDAMKRIAKLFGRLNIDVVSEMMRIVPSAKHDTDLYEPPIMDVSICWEDDKE